MLAVRPVSCLPPLLSPRSPHPTHTLGSWGVETGARVEKRGRQRGEIPTWLFIPPHPPIRVSSGRYRSCGEFSCFCCAKPESHLLQCRCYQHVFSRCNIVSPTNKHFVPHIQSYRARYMTGPYLYHSGVQPGLLQGVGVVFSSCKPLGNAWTFQK